MKTADIRKSFLDYFAQRSHHVASSDSLIPSSDPSLLFTSAGMVQFKPNFQNAKTSPFTRAASCQKCLRTSDIERVGHTLRHLTFFEMLGNFSFGDYFKKEAIAWGWEFLTKTMGLPGERLVVSVHKSDDEAFTMWESWTKKDRIYRLDDDTNFWTMGPTGPCGPCSEILWDRGAEWSCGKPTCSPACDCDRYLEIWNLVFTQFDRQADGRLEPLPQKNIDTGMGLERLSLLSQGAISPFGTDGFQEIYQALAKKIGKPSPSEMQRTEPTPFQTAFRRIADHSRAITFMISDGVLPSNEGRGYVLRRLLRQAVRGGKTLGLHEPFLFELTKSVIDINEGAYPDLRARGETIASVVKLEEERFLETLDTGIRLLDELAQKAKSQSKKTLSGDDVFKLYDTFGFPFELTKEIAEGHGLSVDEKGFATAQQKAADQARQGWKGSGASDIERYREWKLKAGNASTTFRGYDTLETETTFLKSFYVRAGESWKETQTLKAGDEAEVVCRETPFYAEAGGQVGDVGTMETSSGKADVLDTRAPVHGFTISRIRVSEGTLSNDQPVRCRVHAEKRAAAMRHHTATHMLHQALKDILGSHVTQAGSLVAPDRLRFDFTHHAALTAEERQRIEDLVNLKIMNDIAVHDHIVSMKDARAANAVAIFGEKYGELVRCVMISNEGREVGRNAIDIEAGKRAWSIELCGGTHAHATGEIGLFKILGESALASGVRRMEALAGFPALNAIRKLESVVGAVSQTLKASSDDLLPRLEKLVEREKNLEREIEKIKNSQVRAQLDGVAQSARSVGGIRLLTSRLDGVDMKGLREAADRIRDKDQADVAVLAAVVDDKISFIVSVLPKALEKGFDAGKLAKQLSVFLEGSGGGRKEFAQGGGKNVSALDASLAGFDQYLKRP